MKASVRVDRAKISRFFTWTSFGSVQFVLAIVCLSGASWALFLGIAVALRAHSSVWALPTAIAGPIALTTMAVLFLRSAMTRDTRLRNLHTEVTKAKKLDFARALVRSFHRTETTPAELLDTGASGLVSLDPEAVNAEDKELLQTLTPKSVLLSGRKGDGGDMKFLLIGDRLTFEFSPISVSILYLTASELIIYSASTDLVKGFIDRETIDRIPLSEVVEVKLKSTNRRFASAANEKLFLEYTRVLKNNRSNEILATEHSVHVIKTDGSSLAFPAGDLEFHTGRRGVFDAGAGGADRLMNVAEAMTKRIEEARAAAKR